MSEWEQVGTVGVDSGTISIGDPCYHMKGAEWDHFCNTFFKNVQDGVSKNDGIFGVSVETGYGDGVYPVYVRRNSDGRIAEVRVVFIEENEDANQAD